MRPRHLLRRAGVAPPRESQCPPRRLSADSQIAAVQPRTIRGRPRRVRGLIVPELSVSSVRSDGHRQERQRSMNKFLGTMVAGFLGAALLLGVAYATGVVGGTSTTQTVVKGEPASFKTTGLTAQQVYEQNIDGVVEIKSTFPGTTDMWGQSTGEQQGIGTGFVVSTDGQILTNAHVVSESGVTASSVTVVFKGSTAPRAPRSPPPSSARRVDRRRAAQDRPEPGARAHARQAGRLVPGRRRRRSRRHRQPARPRLLALVRRRLRDEP